MTTNRKPEDTLFDAVLRDEWQSASDVIKAEAMRTFHAHQRRRRIVRWTSSAVAAGVVLFGLSHWLAGPTVPLQQVVKQSAPPKAPSLYMNDEELLAAFPKGSCVLAEVDGKKQLIFLDPKLEQVYMAKR